MRKKMIEVMLEFTEIHMIIAIGLDGQIGLNGQLPWRCPKDLKFFRKMTEDGIVVVGRKTWPSVAHLDNTYGRTFLIAGATTYVDKGNGRGKQEYPWDFDIPLWVQRAKATKDNPRPKIWIAGGRKTYLDWAPYVTHLHISHIPYEEEADTYINANELPDLSSFRIQEIHIYKRTILDMVNPSNDHASFDS